MNTKAPEIESKTPANTNLATKVALNAKVTEIENKIPDTTGFITTSEFNRPAKISFDARIIEEAKSLASKSQVDGALDIGDKNREKIKKLSVL